MNPKPYRGAHFAVWPLKLVEPMVLAGSSDHGVCATCGTPWKRERMQVALSGEKPTVSTGGDPARKDGGLLVKDPTFSGGTVLARRVTAGGWAPGCGCGEELVPAVVLDPFSGSASTGRVALKHRRDYIGIDISEEYLPLAVARLEGRRAPQPPEDEFSLSIFDLFGESVV